MTQRPPNAPDVHLADGEIARRDGDHVVVRPSPARLRFDLSDLVTIDDHRVTVTFDCAVQARPEPAERQMLAEAFLSAGPASARCTTADVVRAFTPPLAAAARQTVAARPAADLLSDAVKSTLAEALRKAVDAAGFITGLESVAPYTVHVDSPTLRRLEQDRADRQQAERNHASRLAKLRRSAEVLKEFETLRQSAPDVPVSVLISRLTQSDQADVVQQLIESTPTDVASLYAVAGPHLARVSPDAADLTDIPLPDTIGPFRSVQTIDLNGQPRLAIGGRSGILVLDPAAPESAQAYRAPDVTSAMGFNGIVSWNGRLVASHSEAGIVTWDPDQPDAPVQRIPVEGSRNLLPLGDRLLYTAGSRVCTITDPPAPPAGDPIVALFATPQYIIAIHPSGDVELLDPVTLRTIRRERRAPRVTAAALLPFYDTPRLLLATEDGPIFCLSPDDAAVTQYPSPHRGLRALTVAGHTLAGVSADRQRVILLDSAPGSPVREAHVAARLRHRVGDIAYVR